MSRLNQGAYLALFVSMSCRPIPPYPPPLNEPWTATDTTTIEGVVVSVDRPDDSQSSVNLILEPADRQPIRLVLAPSWYLDQQGIRCEPHESLSINGKRVIENGRPSVLVRTLRKNERSYVLRDVEGRPSWRTP